MKLIKIILVVSVITILVLTLACDDTTGHDDEEEGEHLLIDETYDEVRNGVRLIISYHDSLDSFNGTIENVTLELIEDVRVEVHLSGDIELGPTPEIDLAAGQIENVSLSAEGNTFEWWSVHAEVE